MDTIIVANTTLQGVRPHVRTGPTPSGMVSRSQRNKMQHSTLRMNLGQRNLRRRKQRMRGKATNATDFFEDSRSKRKGTTTRAGDLLKRS